MGFRKDFIWGAASAAYQVEGAYNEDGKGMGVWDVYSNGTTGKIKYNETGNESADHYHRYKEDVQLMKQLGLKYYRFSISWPRVIPNGIGNVNEKGVEFYSNLIDELLENGIEPIVTLFHWNYPQKLQEQGGWLNDDSPEWFEEYVKEMVERFSDRVRIWLTLNEPHCFAGLGYAYGVFAPFMSVTKEEQVHIGHNVLLAHGKAVRVIRKYAKLEPMIGMAPAGPCVQPEDDSKEAWEKAKEQSFAINPDRFMTNLAYWCDPVFLGDYPKEIYEIEPAIRKYIKDGDLELISQPLDFFGVNIYNTLSAENPDSPYKINEYIGCPRTAMGWSINPKTLYYSPIFLQDRYKKPILITENGMSCFDMICLDGKVHDTYRIDYLHRFLRELKNAAEYGVDILGYICWSVMDNFEWAEGYNQRFGLIYVDYRTKERTIKDSGFWYKKVIEENGENL